VHRPGQVDAPRYDMVVLLGSGIGLPSALSALHEFVRRRRAGMLVPRFVWFQWQCRGTEELQLCWDALHRVIYGAKGLCDEEMWENEQQALSSGQRVPLDYVKHVKRLGVPWDEGSEAWAAGERGGGPPMLEWLGITLHVSSWGRSPQAEADGRAQLAQDNPLRTNDPTAERVHHWLCGRVQAGYHDLTELLTLLDNLDHDITPHQPEVRRLCVSMCGSQAAYLRAKRNVLEAKKSVAWTVGCGLRAGGGLPRLNRANHNG